jgi:predicted dehydrogenase
MNRRYRAVLVGCGGRGQSHALGLLANPDRFELVALCDLDAQRLGALAHALGIARVYTDAGAMLAAERPDLLCFATPPAVRVELVELAVRHDVRAIAFEKPLALSLADARRIVELCAGGTKAVVCHQLKYAGHWRRVKQIVEEGGIGEIRSFHATARPSMLRVGTHLVDAVLWLGAGMRATSVLGQAQGRAAYLEDHPCPDHVAGVVEFAGGARGFLEIGSPTATFGVMWPSRSRAPWAMRAWCWAAGGRRTRGSPVVGSKPGLPTSRRASPSTCACSPTGWTIPSGRIRQISRRATKVSRS